MNNSRDQLIEKIVKSSGGKFTKSELLSGNIENIASKLKPDDSRKLKEALSNPQKMKEILSSDAAKKLLDMFAGKDKNG